MEGRAEAEELPSPPPRPSMTALLAGGVAMRRKSTGNGNKSRLDRMMGALQWRHAHLKSEEYPLQVAGVDLKIKQLMQGELTGLGTGATVWPAAHVLSKYMERRWPVSNGGMGGLRVIDLGSGTGAVGLVAKVLGAKEVILTDQEQLAFLMHENATRAVKAMSVVSGVNVEQADELTSEVSGVEEHPGVTVATYDWGLDDSHLSPPFDVVIVSDCVLPKLYPIEPLVEALVELTKPRKGAVNCSPIVLLSYEHRIHEHFDPRVRFEELVTTAGFVKHIIPKSEQDDMYQADDIELWELRLKSDASSCYFAGDDKLSVVLLDDVAKSSQISANEEFNRTCRIQVGPCTYVLNRVSNGGIGGDLWASSLAMATHLLSAYTSGMEGLRVLELGSGIGLVALTCSQLGAKVVATDMEAVLPLLKENITNMENKQSNKGEIEVLPCVWGGEVCERISMGGAFDLILCADCVYAQPSIEPLLSVLTSLATRQTKILFTNEQRSAWDSFVGQASHTFNVQHSGFTEVRGVNGIRSIVMASAQIAEK